MFDIQREELDWCGRRLVLETGRLARQADGAVLATWGETTVLATVVAEKEAKPGQDFFPLTVHYQEKAFAAGRIPGGYLKREGRPSDRETLTSRLIDRPIRPLFPEDFRCDTQVIATVFSYDLENDSDILAMIASSAALTLSGVPFMGPVGAARVGVIKGEARVNPTVEEMKDSSLDLVVAGTADAVLMVESEAQELSEETMLKAVMAGHAGFQPVIQAIIRLAEKAAKEPRELSSRDRAAVEKAVMDVGEADLRAAYSITQKQERYAAVDAVKAKVMAALAPEGAEPFSRASRSPRRSTAPRPRSCAGTSSTISAASTGAIWLPCARSWPRSGCCPAPTARRYSPAAKRKRWWSRRWAPARTSNMSIRWTGPTRSGSCSTITSPPIRSGRRAAWARRAGARSATGSSPGARSARCCRPRPSFPTRSASSRRSPSSNGSSSMATVCGSSLALMDAGVPLKRPTAGIAMGLILEGSRFAVLSDILGDEDHLGDMDFKVAGTSEGVTSLQMDIKIAGITEEIMRQALAQAREGRMHILGEMSKAITGARAELGEFAPRIETMKIPTDKIREVIGSGGKVIREIVEKTGAKINIEDDGTVKIASSDGAKIKAAVNWIKSIASEPEVGQIYDGTVVKTVEFGAFVNFFGSKDGLVHISQLAKTRVAKTTDVVKEGDRVKVKVLGYDDRGKVKLSMRVVDQQTGADLEKAQAPEPAATAE